MPNGSQPRVRPRCMTAQVMMMMMLGGLGCDKHLYHNVHSALDLIWQATNYNWLTALSRLFTCVFSRVFGFSNLDNRDIHETDMQRDGMPLK